MENTINDTNKTLFEADNELKQLIKKSEKQKKEIRNLKKWNK